MFTPRSTYGTDGASSGSPQKLGALGFPLLCLLVARAAHQAQSAAHPDAASASPGNASARTSKHQGIVQKERRFARAKLLLSSYRPGASWLGALARAGSPAC